MINLLFLIIYLQTDSIQLSVKNDGMGVSFSFLFHFYMRVLSQVVSYMFSTGGWGNGKVGEGSLRVSDLVYWATIGAIGRRISLLPPKYTRIYWFWVAVLIQKPERFLSRLFTSLTVC